MIDVLAVKQLIVLLLVGDSMVIKLGARVQVIDGLLRNEGSLLRVILADHTLIVLLEFSQSIWVLWCIIHRVILMEVAIVIIAYAVLLLSIAQLLILSKLVASGRLPHLFIQLVVFALIECVFSGSALVHGTDIILDYVNILLQFFPQILLSLAVSQILVQGLLSLS